MMMDDSLSASPLQTGDDAGGGDGRDTSMTRAVLSFCLSREATAESRFAINLLIAVTGSVHRRQYLTPNTP